MPYPSTPATWVAGNALTAAQLNAQLRDALLAIFPLGPPDVAWTAYTPTLTQGAAVAKTVTVGRYTRAGRLIIVDVVLTVTAAGTAGSQVEVGLPVAAVATNALPVGVALLSDSSLADNHTGIACLETTTTVSLYATRVTGKLGVAQFTAALASPDVVRVSATYESAT